MSELPRPCAIKSAPDERRGHTSIRKNANFGKKNEVEEHRSERVELRVRFSGDEIDKGSERKRSRNEKKDVWCRRGESGPGLRFLLHIAVHAGVAAFFVDVRPHVLPMAWAAWVRVHGANNTTERLLGYGESCGSTPKKDSKPSGVNGMWSTLGGVGPKPALLRVVPVDMVFRG